MTRAGSLLDRWPGIQPVLWVALALRIASVFSSRRRILFATYGAWLRGQKLLREDLFLLVSILFAVAVTAAVFALPRYKILIDPFLMILAANCISPTDSRDPRKNHASILPQTAA